MKEDKIYWKCPNEDYAKRVILGLYEKGLNITLAERKKKNITKLKKFTSGNRYMKSEAIKKQTEFIERNPLQNIYQFYILEY